MLRLFSTGKEVRVVNDQLGAPTWARFIAQSTAFALKSVLEADNDNSASSGIYNLVSSGVVSWYDFARAIRERAGGDPRFGEARLTPIASSEYPTPAKRPRWSVLSTEKIERVFGIHPVPWPDAMRLCVAELDKTGHSV
jgi:dTDP-4-dehydrorhamnose reductase